MKYLKKAGLTLATLALATTTAYAATTFTDSNSFASWFAPSVDKLTSINVIEGYPDGSFKPGNNVNRAELAVMFDRYDTYVNGRIDSQITAAFNTQNGTNAGNLGSGSTTDNGSNTSSNVDLSDYLTQSEIEALINQKIQTELTAELYSQIEADVMADMSTRLANVLSTSFDSSFPITDTYAPYVVLAYSGFQELDHAEDKTTMTLMYQYQDADVYKKGDEGFYVSLDSVIQTNPGAPHGSEQYQGVTNWYGPF